MKNQTILRMGLVVFFTIFNCSVVFVLRFLHYRSTYQRQVLNIVRGHSTYQVVLLLKITNLKMYYILQRNNRHRYFRS